MTTIADELLVESLAPEVREAIERVYAARHHDRPPDYEYLSYTDLHSAYTAGWAERHVSGNVENAFAAWIGKRQ